MSILFFARENAILIEKDLLFINSMKLLNFRNAQEHTSSTKKYKKAALITGASIVVLGAVGHAGAVYDQSSLEQSNTPIVIGLTTDEISMDYHTNRQTIRASLAGISSFAEVTIGDKSVPIKQRENHTGRIEHTIESIPEGDSRVTIFAIDGKRQVEKILTLKRQTRANYDKQELEKQLARTEEALQKAESNMNDETIATARTEIQHLPEEKRAHFSERLVELEKRQQKEKERAEQEKRAAEAEKKRQEEQRKHEKEAAALRAQQRTSRQYTPQPQRQYNAQPRHAAPNPAPQPPAASGPHFKNCKEARAAGYSHMRRGQPGYAPHLDRDNDGIACDKHR